MGTWDDEPERHVHDYRKHGRTRVTIQGDEEVKFEFFRCRGKGKCDKRDIVEITRTKIKKR